MKDEKKYQQKVFLFAMDYFFFQLDNANSKR